MFSLRKFVLAIKRAPLFKSKISFIVLFPFLLFYVWLEFFHYKNVTDEVAITRNNSFSEFDLVNECKSIKPGMTINTVENALASRNKKLVTKVGHEIIIKYWISGNPLKEYLPSDVVCIVIFNTTDELVHYSLVKHEPGRGGESMGSNTIDSKPNSSTAR